MVIIEESIYLIVCYLGLWEYLSLRWLPLGAEVFSAAFYFVDLATHHISGRHVKHIALMQRSLELTTLNWCFTLGIGWWEPSRAPRPPEITWWAGLAKRASYAGKSIFHQTMQTHQTALFHPAFLCCHMAVSRRLPFFHAAHCHSSSPFWGRSALKQGTQTWIDFSLVVW